MHRKNVVAIENSTNIRNASIYQAMWHLIRRPLFFSLSEYLSDMTDKLNRALCENRKRATKKLKIKKTKTDRHKGN